MNGDEVLNELIVGFSDGSALAFGRTEHHVIVERVVDDREAQVLEMHPNLVHPPGERSAKHH